MVPRPIALDKLRDLAPLRKRHHGRHALIGSTNRILRLRDLEAGKDVAEFRGHTAAVMSVAFTSDGKTVVTGGSDKLTRRWRVPTPIEGAPERIQLWAQVITGLELDEHGGTRGLGAATWQKRRQRLQELGGPPEE